MEITITKEALSLLGDMWNKMLMLYPAVDSAADEMMVERATPGMYAIGFALRNQYLSLWKDWEQLQGVIPFVGFAEAGRFRLNDTML